MITSIAKVNGQQLWITSNMTPAKRAKQLGAKSLKQVAYAYGCTVENMRIKFYKKPHQFEIIVLGVVKKVEIER